MKRASRLSAVILAFTWAATTVPASETPPETPSPWTLEAAIARAMENSPDARIALFRVRSAEAVTRMARAPGMPRVRLSAGYRYTNNPMHAFGAILNQRAFEPGIDFNDPGTIDNLNATGSIAWQLYDGGRRSAGTRAADAGLLAAQYEKSAAMLRLQAVVTQTYLDIRKAREAVRAVEAHVRALEAAVEAARARHEHGQLLRADLLSLEVQLAQAREDLLSARHNADLADRAFLFAVGLDADQTPLPLPIAENDPSLADMPEPVITGFLQRPDLLAAQERVHAAEAAVEQARSGRRPTVNLFGSYQYDHGWELASGDDSWAAGIAVDYNLFDGGAVSAEIRRREAELSQAREALRKALLAAELEVEQARLTWEQARERLAVTSAAVAQAEESAALSRARFDEGTLTAADLIGVEGRLAEAHMRHALAVADERLALANLRAALGLPPVE